MDPIGTVVNAAYSTRRRLARLLETAPSAPNRAAHRLAEDGVVVFPELVPAAVIDSVNAANAPLFDFSRPDELLYSPDLVEIKEAADAPPAELRRFYGLHIKNFQRRFDVYRHVVPLIEPVMRAYYRSRFYVRDVYCYRTQPVPTVSGSYKWHTDNYPTGSARAIVYLTDVRSIEDGPLAVAKRSHVGYRPRLGRVGDRYEDAFVRARYEVLPCLGPKGTLILFDNNSIHRATDPARGHRDVINFIMFPALPGPRPAPRGVDLRSENTWLKRYTR